MPLLRPTRSSWPLRLLFGAVFLLILIEGAAVVALVALALLQRLDMPAGVSRAAIGGPVAVQPLGDGDASPTSPANAWDRHGPIDILLLGLDMDDCKLAPTGTARRTDTMILVRVDPATGRVAMMSIPRDLLVRIEGHDRGKINTAYLHGYLDSDTEAGGAALLRDTIQDNLMLPVHRYIQVDFEGFKSMVEALGGVDIDVPETSPGAKYAIYDDAFPDGHCGTKVVAFEPGRQHMDADRALDYARSRHTSSDFDRSRRQIQVLLAMREKALSLGGILAWPKLYPAVMKTVSTDLTKNEIASLLPLAQRMNSDNISRISIDEHVVYDDLWPTPQGNQAVLVLLPRPYSYLRLRFLSAGAIAEPTPDPTDVAEQAARSARYWNQRNAGIAAATATAEAEAAATLAAGGGSAEGTEGGGETGGQEGDSSGGDEGDEGDGGGDEGGGSGETPAPPPATEEGDPGEPPPAPTEQPGETPAP